MSGTTNPWIGAKDLVVVDDQTADRPVQEQGERDPSPRAAGLLVQIRPRRGHPAEDGCSQVRRNEGQLRDEFTLPGAEPGHERPSR